MLRQACIALAGPSRIVPTPKISVAVARPASRAMSTSAPRLQAPRPMATRPRSQMTTKPLRNVSELVDRYPNHPLLAFFSREEQDVLVRRRGEDGKTTDITVRKSLPTTFPTNMFGRDSSSRSWLAPELRTKSSLELHQLWYKCLMERNRLRTTRTEMERIGSARTLPQWKGVRVERRVRKTMARIKFVLNERRLALLEAQRRAMFRLRGNTELLDAKDTARKGDTEVFESSEGATEATPAPSVA